MKKKKEEFVPYTWADLNRDAMDMGIEERKEQLGQINEEDMIYLKLREEYGDVFNEWFAKAVSKQKSIYASDFYKYLEEKK